MKKFLFLPLSVFFISNSLFATTNDKHIFYLDNPTDKNIKITLDSSKNITTINSIENSLFIFHLQSG